MDSLKTILKQTLQGYAGEGANGTSTLTSDTDETAFSMLTVGKWDEKSFVLIDLIVRVVGDIVIIDKDVNSDPLVDALMQAGIPRSQIVLAYAGESAPEPA